MGPMGRATRLRAGSLRVGTLSVGQLSFSASCGGSCVTPAHAGSQGTATVAWANRLLNGCSVLPKPREACSARSPPRRLRARHSLSGVHQGGTGPDGRRGDEARPSLRRLTCCASSPCATMQEMGQPCRRGPVRALACRGANRGVQKPPGTLKRRAGADLAGEDHGGGPCQDERPTARAQMDVPQGLTTTQATAALNGGAAAVIAHGPAPGEPPGTGRPPGGRL